jgi:hypothetical protein
MKQLGLSVFLFGLSWAARSAADPQTLCETRTGTIQAPVYTHCKSGDVVEVDAFEVARRCSLTEPVVPVKERYLCVYRGGKRTIRARPLNDVEKAYEKQHVESLLDKYTD